MSRDSKALLTISLNRFKSSQLTVNSNEFLKFITFRLPEVDGPLAGAP